jgi:hypothetical protein
MKKVYACIFILCSFYLIQGVRIEVEYDTERDMIIKGGKVYLPIGENFTAHPKASNIHEEELATGAKFWFYIFMVISKIYSLI